MGPLLPITVFHLFAPLLLAFDFVQLDKNVSGAVFIPHSEKIVFSDMAHSYSDRRNERPLAMWRPLGFLSPCIAVCSARASLNSVRMSQLCVVIWSRRRFLVE